MALSRALCLVGIRSCWELPITGNIGTEVKAGHAAGYEIPSWRSTIHPQKSGKATLNHACGESPGAARACRIVFAILQAVTREIPNPSCNVNMEVLRGISEESR